jgi:ribose transport system substrate-binding protein
MRRFPQGTTTWIAVGVLCGALCAGCGGSSGDGSGGAGGASAQPSDAGPGITKPATLPPFTPSPKAGVKPNLPKVIAYAQSSPNETEQAIASGLKAGADDAGLQFSVANSHGDPQKQVQNMQQFLVKGVGALVTGPVDPAAQAPVIRDAIDKGAAAFTLVFGPGTNQVNASQYAVGKALADVAKEYIDTKLGGKANVVLINQDNVPPIRPRFKAIRDVLRSIPGMKIVSDITPALQDNEHGFQTMNTVLQKTPNVDVVLGADTVVQGALAALQASHKANDRQFLGGLDGIPSALADISKGGPYKATVALAPAIFGYAWSQYASDWLAGKSIPQAIDVVPLALTNAAQISAYKQDEDNPAAVWKDKQRLAKYLQMFGSISYATRGQYLAYNWTR